MKRIIPLLVILATFASCATDVKFNNPAFQGQKDNFFWKADRSKVIISGTRMTIQGMRGLEKLEISIPVPAKAITKANPSTYIIGEDDKYVARYQFSEDGVIFAYATGTKIGNGQLVISEYNPTQKKLSATFRFNAVYQGGIPNMPVNVNYQGGFVYKIPITKS